MQWRPSMDVLDVWFWQRVKPGQALVLKVSGSEREWVEIPEGALLGDPTYSFQGFELDLLLRNLPDPVHKPDANLTDAREVRDRMIALVERAFQPQSYIPPPQAQERP